ncbi:DNA repair protein RadA, partial [Streptomyces sp. NPDC003236]
GPASDHTIGDTRAAILRHVRANPGAKPKDIADALPQVDTDTVRRTCSRMATDGQLTKDGSGRYYPDTHTRTQTTQQVSQLSDCPVTTPDQHKQPGQSELELSGLSDRSARARQQGGI